VDLQPKTCMEFDCAYQATPWMVRGTWLCSLHGAQVLVYGWLKIALKDDDDAKV
jgi:hypothetical protein